MLNGTPASRSPKTPPADRCTTGDLLRQYKRVIGDKEQAFQDPFKLYV